MMAFIFTAAAAFSDFRAVEVLRVYDGDTFKVNLVNQDEVFGKNISIRIRGIDAPEIRSDRKCEKEDAVKSKESLQKFLSGKRVDLNRCQRDKFFRLTCDVTLFNKKTEDATAYQLAKGWAKPYTGGYRDKWVCKK